MGLLDAASEPTAWFSILTSVLVEFDAKILKAGSAKEAA